MCEWLKQAILKTAVCLPDFRELHVDCSNSVVEVTVGEVAEWLMAPVLKTGIPERVSGVRIPPSPPSFFFPYLASELVFPLRPES